MVVAVLDWTMNPYHWDFGADKMPQAIDLDRTNDLPLDRPPHEWLPGFPEPTKAFDSYEPLRLSLETKNEDARLETLLAEDATRIKSVKTSAPEVLNYYWVPGTKVIGALSFTDDPASPLVGPTDQHGVGATSVSTGNIHGACPECLLVFINLDRFPRDAEAAIAWAMDQPWIDVISNSYLHSDVPKTFIYNGSTVDEQRVASMRGQSLFFAAHNGTDGFLNVPNTTLMSSQGGPDWPITVGAVSPGQKNPYPNETQGTSDHASYTGAGKPVDIAGLGMDYPSAYYAETVSETGSQGFSGTSNATPTIAGTYARALYLARRNLQGPSRTQSRGVIARGAPFACGEARPRCELGDGILTAAELRTRLFHGAIHTPAGMTTYGHGVHTVPIGEEEFLNEGHGTYFAREAGDDAAWLAEFDRIMGPLEGRTRPLQRPPGEREWMLVDSYCRQSIWGPWGGGYYVEHKTDLPPPDALWPLRSLWQQACPYVTPPP